MPLRFSPLVVLPFMAVLVSLSCAGSMTPGVLVEYRRTGGFMGLDDHLIVDATGKVRLTRQAASVEFTLDRDMMNRLLNLLESSQLTGLRREYLPARKGADLFEYTITYKGHRVRAVDTAVPESLQPVIDLLNEIVEDGSSL